MQVSGAGTPEKLAEKAKSYSAIQNSTRRQNEPGGVHRGGLRTAGEARLFRNTSEQTRGLVLDQAGAVSASRTSHIHLPFIHPSTPAQRPQPIPLRQLCMEDPHDLARQETLAAPSPAPSDASSIFVPDREVPSKPPPVDKPPHHSKHKHGSKDKATSKGEKGKGRHKSKRRSRHAVDSSHLADLLGNSKPEDWARLVGPEAAVGDGGAHGKSCGRRSLDGHKHKQPHACDPGRAATSGAVARPEAGGPGTAGWEATESAEIRGREARSESVLVHDGRGEVRDEALETPWSRPAGWVREPRRSCPGSRPAGPLELVRSRHTSEHSTTKSSNSNNGSTENFQISVKVLTNDRMSRMSTMERKEFITARNTLMHTDKYVWNGLV